MAGSSLEYKRVCCEDCELDRGRLAADYDQTTDIHDLLIQQLPSPPSAASPIQFNPDIPKTYAYLLSHVSKVLITQAQSEITSKPASAFPLAKVVVGLMLRGHAALGDVLFARFVKKCPWVVPFYPAPQAVRFR